MQHAIHAKSHENNKTKFRWRTNHGNEKEIIKKSENKIQSNK